MSRHSFDEVISNTKDLDIYEIEDKKGYRLSDWIDFGIIGWDENINTYYIQLDVHIEEIPWWFGSSSNEIATFDHLCEIVNKIFGVKDGFFRFSNVIDKVN